MSNPWRVEYNSIAGPTWESSQEWCEVINSSLGLSFRIECSKDAVTMCDILNKNTPPTS